MPMRALGASPHSPTHSTAAIVIFISTRPTSPNRLYPPYISCQSLFAVNVFGLGRRVLFLLAHHLRCAMLYKVDEHHIGTIIARGSLFWQQQSPRGPRYSTLQFPSAHCPLPPLANRAVYRV